MVTMSLVDIVTKFEYEASSMFQFQVLEILDSRYLFGSGYAVYRSGGINFRIVYEGREGHAYIEISEKHQKYPECTWEVLFAGESKDVFGTGLRKLATHLTS
jgi:hypothetical protein